MARFDRQIKTALRLIQKNGQAVAWVKTVDAIPDADMPWLPVGTTNTNFAPYICFLPLDLQGKEFLHALGVTDAFTGTYYGLMGNVPFEPLVTDVVTRDGVKLDIASIDLLSPNGQKILYTIIFNG